MNIVLHEGLDLDKDSNMEFIELQTLNTIFKDLKGTLWTSVSDASDRSTTKLIGTIFVHHEYARLFSTYSYNSIVLQINK